MDRRCIITPKTRRLCRTLKWAGVLGCVLIVGVAIQDFSLMSQGGVGIGVWDVGAYLVAFLVLLAVTVYVWRLGRPWPRGHCQVCGYDLTGNVSGTCSECGTPIRVRDQQDQREQPDLPDAAPSQCCKCGCDLTDRYTGQCPECGAETSRFPPGCCPNCGYSLVAETDEVPCLDTTQPEEHEGELHFCIFCKRLHPRRYPRGYCGACGYNLSLGKHDRCPGCGNSISKEE